MYLSEVGFDIFEVEGDDCGESSLDLASLPLSVGLAVGSGWGQV